MSDKPLESCPKAQCQQRRWGKGKVKRLIGAGAGLIFKGSGFYITDYRKDSYKEAAKKETMTSSSSSSSKTSGTGTETKAAAKTESKPAAAHKSNGK